MPARNTKSSPHERMRNARPYKTTKENPMKIVFIFGPSAVGKMTVGQELAKITDLRLFHNHMMLEPVLEIFGGKNERKGIVLSRLREVICEEFALSGHSGLIMTGLMDMNNPNWEDLLAPVRKIFEPHNAEFYYVELRASQEVRLGRNITENRLQHKASKRDFEKSNWLLVKDDDKHFYHEDSEINVENYIKIDNTDLAPDVVARMIKERFGL